MPVLLVIDDEPLTLDCFRHLLPREQATVVTATSAAEGLQQFTEQRPDAVVLDVRLTDMSGLELFRRFHDLDPRVPVILVTGYGSAEIAIEAMGLGAYEYVVKPLDLDQLRGLISRAFKISRLMQVPATFAVPAPGDEAGDVLIGKCSAMQEVYKAIGRAAPQDVTVLISGESGTGKELVARALYHHSKRARMPFLAINCAAIPEGLLESELFGHEKGSFTGADRKRIGKFEQCHGGTLFLDEIGDMTPLTQAKVLRVLQDRQFERVGSNVTLQSDVRIIAATNRDLEAMVADGRFRADLYYRLNVYTITLPPLRQRGEDLALLVEYFLKRFSRELEKPVRSIAPDALDLLQRYSWPGNVRELQSVLKQAVLRTTGPVLVPEFLPAPVRSEGRSAPAAADLAPSTFDLTSFVRERLQAGSTNLHAELHGAVERHLLLQILEYSENNISQAARILGISRTTLRNKLAALGLSIERSASLGDEAAS